MRVTVPPLQQSQSALHAPHDRQACAHTVIGNLRWVTLTEIFPRAICQAILTNVSVISERSLPADPVEALRVLTEGEAELEQLRLDRVRAAREAGVSWARIGEVLGMSRQAAWEYYNRDLRDLLGRNAGANGELTEHDAMDLAVAETRVVRRRRRTAD